MSQTDYRRQLKSRVLHAAMDEFTLHGIKAVKMDDIARQLSISKRTLYELYANKEDLLLEGLKRYHEQNRADIHKASLACGSVMDIILLVYRYKTNELHRVNPLFYLDMIKYPKVIKYFEEERLRNQSQFIDFMKRGVEEGCFLPDLNYTLLAEVYDLLNNQVINCQIYRIYSLNEIFYNLLFVTLRGFCTQKGIAILDTFLEQIRLERA